MFVSHLQDAHFASIVIPSYFAAGTLEETLNSLLGQESIGEVVVLLNGQDDSEQILLDFMRFHPDLPLRFERAPSEILEAGENWRRAIAAAKFPYVKLLCADDQVLDGAIAKQVVFLKKNLDCALVSGKRRVVTPIGKTVLKNHGGAGLDTKNNLYKILLSAVYTGTNPIGEPSSVLFRTRLVQESLPWNEDSPYVIDLEMYLRILKKYCMQAGYMKEEVATFTISISAWSFRLRNNQSQQFRSLLLSYLNSMEGFKKLNLIKCVLHISSRLTPVIRRLFYFRLQASRRIFQ